MTPDQVRERLEAEAKKAGSQAALAREIQISPAYLNDILSGKREPAGKVLEHLNLRRVVTYEPAR